MLHVCKISLRYGMRIYSICITWKFVLSCVNYISFKERSQTDRNNISIIFEGKKKNKKNINRKRILHEFYEMNYYEQGSAIKIIDIKKKKKNTSNSYYPKILLVNRWTRTISIARNKDRIFSHLLVLIIIDEKILIERNEPAKKILNLYWK